MIRNFVVTGTAKADTIAGPVGSIMPPVDMMYVVEVAQFFQAMQMILAVRCIAGDGHKLGVGAGRPGDGPVRDVEFVGQVAYQPFADFGFEFVTHTKIIAPFLSCQH